MTAEPPAPRTVSDARELRALAHPLRIDLLELLIREGPLTATRAGELLGQSPANCSFHLRTLAKYGFVEEVPGAKGRQRPWRAVGQGVRLDDFSSDAELNVAAGQLIGLLVQRDIERMRHWFATRSAGPVEWRDSGFGVNALVYLTPAELAELDDAVNGFLARVAGRAMYPASRPDGARPVTMVALGFPLDPTPSGG